MLLGNPVSRVVRLIPELIELDPESLSTDESIDDVKRLLNAVKKEWKEGWNSSLGKRYYIY